LSDDAAYGLTVIAFVGSVFSPYYARARARGAAEAGDYCAFNVALYGKHSNRWAMTERGARNVVREADTLSIGRSVMRRAGDALEIDIDELCAPLPQRVRGKIRLLPSSLTERSFALDGAGLHTWTPFAPCARIEVQLSHPEIHWSGIGYFDSNRGAEPLESAFCDWTWSRSSHPDSSIVLYDVNPRNAPARSLALRFAANGDIEAIDSPPPVVLGNSRWGIARRTRADAGENVRIVKTLQDAPFYTRTLLDTCLSGSRTPAIHESLNLNRFRSGWVQLLLPFRMPRSLATLEPFK
jgi:carotenoid 1,2-hydratase